MLRAISILIAGLAVVACVRLWLFPFGQAPQTAGREMAKDAVVVVASEQGAVPTATIVTARAEPTPKPSVTLPPLRAKVRLGPFVHVWQTRGNCGPATLSMLLGYYGIRRSQAEIASVLKPQPNDPDVRLEQLATYAQELGLRTRIGLNGSLDMVMGLLNVDLPVMALQLIDYDGGAAHFRLLKGYDKTRGVAIFDDSLTGPDRELSFAWFDAEWRPVHRAYVLVYPPSKESLVAAVLGPDWNEATMLARAVQAAEEWCTREPTNAFAHFALGESRLALGRAEAAWSAYERALAIGMPRRTLWYFQGPIEALVETGRYAEALRLIGPVLAVAPDVEELHYLRGRALDGLGRHSEARQAYLKALSIRPNYSEVQQALAAQPSE